MNNRKMSLAQPSKSRVKKEIDQMLEVDYQYWRNNQHKPQAILKSTIVQRTPLIKQYMEDLQIQYNIPSPLKHRNPKKTSKGQRTKIDVSLKNSFIHKNNSSELSQQKSQPSHQRKLTIVIGKGSQVNTHTHVKRESGQQRQVQPMATPKFGALQMIGKEFNFVESVICSDDVRVRRNTEQRNRSNTIQLKQKPQRKTQVLIMSATDQLTFTAKKRSQSSHSGEVKEFSLRKDGKSTVKKINNECSSSQQSSSQFNSHQTILHSNPMKQKALKRSKEKVEQEKLIIKDSYRYCVGCQFAILSANIKDHQITCSEFRELSFLSNAQLLNRLKEKLKNIEEKVSGQKGHLNPEEVENIQKGTKLLVEESRSRGKGMPESPRFKEHYGAVMNIGAKWCLSLEEVNKLHWFTRIITKLQSLQLP